MQRWNMVWLGARACVTFCAACSGGALPMGPAAGGQDVFTQDDDGGVDQVTHTESISGLPCDVAMLLSTYCTSCHSDPPLPGTPMTLASDQDLSAASASHPDLSNAELSLMRMRDAKAPMPPSGSTPSSAEIAAFAAWLDAGSPAGTCDAVSDPFDTETVCSTDSHWRSGNEESPNMHPGVACINCHDNGLGGERGPRFALAGTVYQTGHEPDDCNGVNGKGSSVTVEVTDANGTIFTLRPNSVGNFYRERSSLAFPISARVLFEGRVREMRTQVSSGDCNSCHTEQGAEDAPGRIMLP